jgi:flagellar hook assembly protein FlgD
MVFGGTASGVGNPPPGDLPAQAVVTISANPNPFNPRTTFSFNLSRPGPVRLAIYDIRGAQVATLVAGAMPAGKQSVNWDGLDARGGAAPSGIYFARLETESGKRTVKVALAR